MAINYVDGNLLDSHANFLCHQVNCQKVMGSGIAKQIREAYPKVYQDYVNCFQDTPMNGEHYNLGGIVCSDIRGMGTPGKTSIVSMFAQDRYGRDGRRYTNYEAFYQALEKIAELAEFYKETYNMTPKIAFSYKIGCGLGGGNWEIIITMIKEVLAKDYDVYIYRLQEGF